MVGRFSTSPWLGPGDIQTFLAVLGGGISRPATPSVPGLRAAVKRCGLHDVFAVSYIRAQQRAVGAGGLTARGAWEAANLGLAESITSILHETI